MRRICRMPYLLAVATTFAILFGIALSGVPAAHAQVSISSGSIQGVILDPKGASVSSAKVTVTAKSTGQKFTPPVSNSGEFSASSLIPGEYVVRIEAAGFKTFERTLTVQVGTITSGSATLELGSSSETIVVEGSAVQVNSDQAVVSGVLTTQQIENLPINGRNFLDLAQLEPGVQIQDGANFDPTKTGFSSISFGGRFGRTARIEVDGVDVSDETVGTTTTAIPASALQEFQISQSTLDLSNELTSSGSVSVITRSGTNAFHGQAFDLFRDSSEAASLPHSAGVGKPPFQRSQFGGNFGGPILKDKLFFFADGERTKQDLFNAVSLDPNFAALASGYSVPYRESNLLGKVDYIATPNLKLFYRFTYFGNFTISPSAFQPFVNKDYTRTHAAGADWTTGSFSHSFRFQYLKFENQILPDLGGLPFSNVGVNFVIPGSANAAFGANLLAPQTTPQSNRQVKYDGSKTLHSHILRYGFGFNHIQGGGFAKFFGVQPQILSGLDPNAVAFAKTSPFAPGGVNNPLNYPVEFVVMGNGLGFGTELKSFGFPAGGLGPDNRVALYFGDSWRVKTNLTVSAGLRWARDTGRTDSDRPAIPAINTFYPGFGNQVRQPNINFGPQAGIAWDPFKSGKTVIRAGGGIYYENVIWNNVLFDRPLRLPTGAFFNSAVPCIGPATPNTVTFADGTNHPAPANLCGVPTNLHGLQSIGAAAPIAIAFQKAYQASAAANGLNAPNGAYLPPLIASGASALPTGFFAPNFQTPRSVQMNFGVQRQVWRGSVLSADFIRNVGTHLSLGQDINHVGDTRYFDKNAAQAAISATNNAFGCGTGFNAASINCAIAAGASMADFARNGLGTPGDAGVGACIPALGSACAFGGVNPNVPGFTVQKPIGRSTYDALQVKLVQNVNNPLKGVKNASFQVAYSLSRFDNNGAFNGAQSFQGAPAGNDLDFVSASLDNANPFRYFGPSALDRTHQFSFGGTVDVRYGFRAGVIGHFYSALPTSLSAQNSGAGPGEIFRSDFTGDGTVADPLPGTVTGSFGRGISASGLNAFLTNFNNKFAGQATPAGQVLISNNLFTLAQLQALNGVIQPVCFGTAPASPTLPCPQGAVAPGNVPMYGLRAFDLKLSWVHKFKERLTVEPSVSAYNLFNFINFDLPTGSGGTLDGVLSGAPGSVNGTTYGTQTGVRVGSGTGTFGLGSPRVIEWGLKLTF
jgi:hypothetical protein